MNPNNNNVPSDLFLTKSQVLLGPQSQSQIQTSSQQLQPLLGQQQILCSPEQPQLQFRPISLPQSQNTQQPTEVPILNFQVRDYNTTNHHHNQMEALMSRLNQLENLHYNYNKTLIGYLDHLNNVDKNLSEILNDYATLGRRLNNAIQNTNALKRNISVFLSNNN